MAITSHKTVKFPEILSAVVGKTTNGASTVVSGRTRIPIASANTFGITTSWYYYNSASAPGYKVTAVTATYVEVTGTPTAVLSGKAVIFGLPTTVTAGMSKFYLRLGANIYAQDPIYFNKENASEGFKVELIANATAAHIWFTPAVPVGSPAIGSSIVYIGGITAATNDIVTFTDVPSKSAVAEQNNFSFVETISAHRTKSVATSDSISFGQSVTKQSKYTRVVSETFQFLDSTAGHARIQNVYITDAFSISDVVRRNLVVNTNDLYGFADNAITPMRGFVTPTTKITPPILPDTKGQAYLLYRHYAVREAHVNVYQLLDGTFVQNYPTPENSNTNIPLPWNPSDPTAPYSVVTNWDGTIQRFYLENPIVRVFYGGETTMVTQETANQLIQAGYQNYIVSV